MTDSLAELIAQVNALPSTAAMLQAVAHLRTFYDFPDIHPDDMPHAMASLASFGAPQAAVPAETAVMAHGASGVRPSPEAPGERAERDDSPETRADRLAAGASTVRLTGDLGGTLADLAPHGAFPDMRPTAFWYPDAGPRIPIGVCVDWFTPGVEADMLAKDRETWNEAWLFHGGTMAARWCWEASRTGQARPLLVAADDSTPF